jgi:exosortase/archaeosortase family protein
MTRSRNSKTPVPPGAAKGRLSAAGGAVRSRAPILRFFLLFALFVAGYYAVTAMPWFASGVFPATLRANAQAGAFVLRLLGEPVQADGSTIFGPLGVLNVRRGCDALEPAALVIAAMVAFPAPWRSRALGAAAALPLLLLLNLVRIVSLYYALRLSPDWFEVVHVDLWQPLFILCAVALWVVWVILLARAGQRRASPGGAPSVSEGAA